MIIQPCELALLQHGQKNSWDAAAKERLLPHAWPKVEPSFQLAKGDRVFTIGSCFARNIEDHLQRLGFGIPTLDYSVPHHERAYNRPNHGLIKYTPADILQEIAWAEQIFSRDGNPVLTDFEAFAYPDEKGKVRDLGIATPWGVARAVSCARFEQRRQEIYAVWEQAFKAHCVVITLGFIESWFDKSTELYIVHPPKFIKQPDKLSRFEFRTLGYQDCLEMILDSLKLIRQHNPNIKVLITTSPVPMSHSYSVNDVLIANSHSKATLRAVCGELENEEGVDYFPSYESVTLTHDWNIWGSDRRHISDAFVGKIVGQLTSSYFGSADQARKLLQAAATAWAEHNVDEALSLSTEATELDASIADAWLIRAQSAQRKGFLEEAMKCTERCLNLSPECTSGLKTLIETQLDTGLSDNSLDLANQYVSLEPHNPNSHYLQGRVMWETGNLSGAREAFERAANTPPCWAVFHHRLVAFLLKTEQFEDALEWQRARVDSAPNDPAERIELCDCLLATNQVDEVRDQTDILSRCELNSRQQHRLDDIIKKTGTILNSEQNNT
jgi:tetratricopeptide (TPR) repeat protein